MTPAIYLLFSLHLSLLVCLTALARRPLFGVVAQSAVNPMLVFSLVSFLFNLDFLVVYHDHTIDFIERVSSVSEDTIANAYFAYTCLFLGAVLGMVTVMASWRGPTRDMRSGIVDYSEQRSVSSAWLFGFSLLCYAAVRFSSASVDDDLSYQVIARSNPAANVATSLTIVTLIRFIAFQRRVFTSRNVIVFATVLLGIGSAGGARTIPLLGLLALCVAYASIRRLSAAWYIVAIPTLGVLLSFSAYWLRDNAGYGSFASFVAGKGGMINLFFAGEELSFAKVFSVLYELAPNIQIPPYHGLAAALVAPIPRNIFDLKPLGPSAIFTQFVSPVRWEWTKSETLVTGYGELYWQLGLVGASVITCVFGAAWTWLCLRVANSSRIVLVAWLPLLIWSMYAFVRGDLFNVSLLLWPAFVVSLAHRGLARVLTALHSSSLRTSELRTLHRKIRRI
jgi:hypothetical protein